MAPLLLKIKGNKTFSPFSNLASEEDLSKTWRVCTKVKDSLENGSRLENLSWRLWFRQHALNEKSSGGSFQKLSKTTTSQLDHHQAKLTPTKDKQKHNNKMVDTAPEIKQPDYSQFALTQQSLISNNYDNNVTLLDQQLTSHPQQQPGTFSSATIKSEPHSPLVIDTGHTVSNFTLHQFTSDQARDQIVELEDIFDAFDNGFLQQSGTAHLMVDDSNWASTATQAATIPPNYHDPSTISPYGNNSSNYCTPLSSPVQSHAYRQSPAEQQYHPQYSYHNQQNHTYHQYQYQDQQRLYSSSVNNNGMFMSVPSSPSFLPQPSSSNFDPPAWSNKKNDSMFVSTGSLNMKHHGLIPQQATQLTSGVKNTLSTPPLSTSSSSSSTVTTTQIKNDEISNDDDDYSGCTTEYDSQRAQSTATTPVMPNNDHAYSHYQHQHVFPVSAPTTPPLHTQHQYNPFDSVSRRPNIAKLSATASTSGDGADTTPVCTNCNAISTPLWRRSAEDELLCNACGLYQKLHNAPRPKTLKPHNTRKDNKEEESVQLVCSNCSTTTTPLWRRDDEGAPLCNACGLYLKLHHEKRPLSMKTDIIKKRQRYETSTQSTGGRKCGKKTKGQSTSSSAQSSPSQSTLPSPEGHINTDKDYPSSPTFNPPPPFSYSQPHLPSFMN